MTKADKKVFAVGTSADRLPTFFAVGPPRTATTWLYNVLKGHTGLPKGIKETQFFSWNHDLGIDWYKNFFLHCPPDLPVGEIGPAYFDYALARARIKECIPNAKVIITLRDPLDRIYSQYKLWRSFGLIDGPFDYATQRRELSASSSYSSNIRAWIKLFGRDRLLLLFHEDLEKDPQDVVRKLCAFIGIPGIDLVQSKLNRRRVLSVARSARSRRLARSALRLKDSLIRRQKCLRIANLLEDSNPVFNFCFSGGPGFTPLDPRAKSTLRAILRPEIEDLENLVHRDLSHWK